jgi:hypothetical protein
VALQLIDHYPLIGIVAGEPVGTVADDHRKSAIGSPMPQPVEARPF